jgi:hypothetical protein
MSRAHLTEMTVRALRPRDQQFRVWDTATPGFGCLVSGKRKSWIVMFGKRRHLKVIGVFPDLSLADARKTAKKILLSHADHAPTAMRTEPDFIASMKKRARSTEFACYVRNYTANAVRLQIPFLSIESAPRMSEEDHATLLTRNRAQYAVQSIAPIPQPKSKDPQPETKPQPPPRTGSEEGSTDAASKW